MVRCELFADATFEYLGPMIDALRGVAVYQCVCGKNASTHTRPSLARCETEGQAKCHTTFLCVFWAWLGGLNGMSGLNGFL